MKEAKGRSAGATGAAGGNRRTGTPFVTDDTAALSNRPTRRDTRERGLLDRILDTPHLAHVVPRLQPELLHQVIQTCGLEDCSEVVSLITPEQLKRIFDLDLWRAARAGTDEQFDTERFGVWLEVLLECGAAVAARKVVELDIELVVAGLAQYVLVFDRAAGTSYTTTDGEEVGAIDRRDDALTCDLGGYVLVARRPEASPRWDAIVTVLLALEGEYKEFFHQVMSGCRALSNSTPEIDGLHELLGDGDQVMFDLALDRERRREKQGYVTPAQARSFLQMSRELRLGADTPPPTNAVARAYFRGIDEPTVEQPQTASRHASVGSDAPVAPEDVAKASTALVDVLQILRNAGLLGQQLPALRSALHEQPTRLGRIESHMQFVFHTAPGVYLVRNQELAYLANTIMAGSSIQARPFTAREASDAAVAVCNLGLANFPLHWISSTAAGTQVPDQTRTTLPDDFLVVQDLISVFQVGWTILHQDVCMYAAEQLIDILSQVKCEDSEIQTELDVLRIDLKRDSRAGAPWRSRDALDVIASLDMLAWATLLALIDELPVVHAALGASRAPGTLAVGASDFEFISENSQIASIREFMRSLPEILCR